MIDKSTGLLFLILSLFVSTTPNAVNRYLNHEDLFYITWVYTSMFFLLFAFIFSRKAIKNKAIDLYSGTGAILSILVLIFENYIFE